MNVSSGGSSRKSGKSKSGQNRDGGKGGDKSGEGPPVELENQFIMRLPDGEAATALRKAIESGASNLKERLFIQLEPDKTSNNQYLRKGRVQFDGWNFTSRLVDLPTIIESHKTIDSNTLYKTADICQLMMCKEGDEFEKEEAESPNRKKKDPNKVDKKYIYPHGLGPPLKNCRKRRFRKTLKKKYVEAPEIEKEVKRLLRHDNEAMSVNWEVITEDELLTNKGGEAGKDNPDVHPSQSGTITNDHKDLGLDLSSDEDDNARDFDPMDSEDNSRMSVGDDSRFDSRMSDSVATGSMSASVPDQRSASSLKAESNQQMPLQFTSDMFAPPPPPNIKQRSEDEQDSRAEMMLLKSRMKELEHNIKTCVNVSLKEKFKKDLKDIKQQIKEKEG
eukprot:TRINITY_DN3126_c0_g1_i1.p1 TRINITY_DN3126_c0_g1~~TRINITY_DN3126_c0_g1_i1.p1  ORF type:complete len:390 (+),score=112.78 TRINITY_DN3126_c0_g1_i1:44-1213(+)